MDFKEAYETLELKFTSGNPIPVERSTILDKEWKAIKGELKKREDNLNWYRSSIIGGYILLFIVFFIYCIS